MNSPMTKTKNDVNSFRLDNGLQIVHKSVKSTQMVHCGLFVKAGSLDETEISNGSAHFIEHALFKGTENRSATQLFNLVESVGGELNAYTTREMTCYYASSLKKYLPRSLDLLSDMWLNSLLKTSDLDKERKVIFEEIEMYEDSPDDCIYDDFMLRFFKDNPLGYNILGTKASLADLGSAELRNFMSSYYLPENMVLSVVGNVTFNKVKLLAERFFAVDMASKKIAPRNKIKEPSKFSTREEKDFQQTHCLLGGASYDRYDPKRYAFMLLNNILGGQNMSSRLNLSVREKHGLCYHISSSYQTFDDAGVQIVSLGCDKSNVDKALQIIRKEQKMLKEKRLGPVLLSRAKRQLQGHFAMASESPGFQMQNLAKSYLTFGKFADINDLFKKIDLVTASDLMEVANEIYSESNLCELVYIGEK